MIHDNSSAAYATIQRHDVNSSACVIENSQEKSPDSTAREMIGWEQWYTSTLEAFARVKI